MELVGRVGEVVADLLPLLHGVAGVALELVPVLAVSSTVRLSRANKRRVELRLPAAGCGATSADVLTLARLPGAAEVQGLHARAGSELQRSDVHRVTYAQLWVSVAQIGTSRCSIYQFTKRSADAVESVEIDRT